MPLKNTNISFGHLARAFHWLSALLVLCLLIMGFYLSQMDFSPFKLELFGLHKSFGMTVLGLTLLRLTWRFSNQQPDHLTTHNKTEKILASLVHIILYVSLFGMPLSGWIMSNAGEFPNQFFGLFEWPAIAQKDEELFKSSREAHEFFAFTFIIAIGLHILGALKHHLIDRDETLKRMGGNLILALIGCALLGASAFFVAKDLYKEAFSHITAEIKDPETTAPTLNTQNKSLLDQLNTDNWHVNHDTSAINFTFSQYGEEIDSSFERWDADIVFYPNDLENSHAKIIIDINSIKTGSEDRDTQAKGNEWFDIKNHPNATFESTRFTKTAENEYMAAGSLTIKDISQDISFPFSLKIEEINQELKANMNATLGLNRLNYSVGTGQWESTDAINDLVNIELKINATKPKQ